MWTIGEIETALEIKGDTKENLNITGISIDSRTIKKGELFIALQGDNFDGNKFISSAVQNGAKAAIVSKKDNSSPIPQIIVDDPYEALVKLAQYRRSQAETKIVAITGSVGKTSCKSMLHDILSIYGKSYASIGNYNNHIGLPLSLVNMPVDTEFGVFELGMNHSGEIKYLSDILKPDFTWITIVNDAHSGNFDSEEQIVHAKAEIFSGLNPKGGIILNNSGKNYNKLRDLAINQYHHNNNIIKSYGENEIGELFIRDIELNKDKKFVVNFSYEGEEFQITFGFYNIALIRLLLGIIVILSNLQLDYKKSFNHFSNLQPIKGRGNVIKSNNITIIDDSYNANPASMNAAFDNLNVMGEILGGRTVAIIGTMLELGNESMEKHLKLEKSLVDNHIDKVITIGKYMENLYHALPLEMRLEHFDKVQGNIDKIKSYLKQDDAVLVKASRGVKTDLIVKEVGA